MDFLTEVKISIGMIPCSLILPVMVMLSSAINQLETFFAGQSGRIRLEILSGSKMIKFTQDLSTGKRK